MDYNRHIVCIACKNILYYTEPFPTKGQTFYEIYANFIENFSLSINYLYFKCLCLKNNYSLN